jgi:hypothetical protein
MPGEWLTFWPQIRISLHGILLKHLSPLELHMKTARSGRLAALLIACGTLLFPASSIARAEVPFSAVIEKVEFSGVSAETQKLIEQRIGGLRGDKLTAETRQRVGRELNRIHKSLTFTYKSGATPATAKLIISGDC